jgi:signal transduction histidine kinase
MNAVNVAKLPSLRRELVRTLTLISAFWLSAVFFTMAFGIRHEVDELLDDALQESAEVLYGIVALHGTTLPLHTGGILPAPPHEERLVWQIVDQHQKVVLHSHKAPTASLLPFFKAGLSDAPGHWRVYAMRLPLPDQVLYVGQHVSDRLESRYAAIIGVGAGGLVAGLICAIWMRRRVIRALRPVQQLADHIKRYDPLRRETALPAPTRQEFVEVLEAITDLGHRLARRVEGEQAFAAHAAHALRTPLAGMDAQLAMAMKEVPEATRVRLQRTREAMSRLKSVVTSLLSLFRSTAALELQDLRLAELVSRIPVDALKVHVDEETRIKADPNLLAAALGNLLENSVRYGGHNCWLTVRTEGSSQYLTVRDDGSGVSDEQRQALQHSVDQPAEAGFVGLGLRLAALVARAHDGKLVIDGGSQGPGGFSVTLALWLDEQLG